MEKNTKIIIGAIVVYIIIGMFLAHCTPPSINPIYKILFWPINLLNGTIQCSTGV